MKDAEANEIAALIAAGDAPGAYARLRAVIGWPHGKTLVAAELPRAIALLAEVATHRGAAQLAELAIAVVRDPDSPDHLYELGYALIDAGAPTIAATVLWRCLSLVGDSEEVVCELVSALESALAYPDALALLEQHASLRQRSFLCRYLYAFNAAMAGQLAITRATLPLLAPDSDDTLAMETTIADIVMRADRVAPISPLDARDLRGWHYVLTGGLLMHQSPYGHDHPMHGRYGFLADIPPLIAFGIERMVGLVRGLDIPCVYAPEGRSHEILAHAVAERLGIPRAPWPAIGVPAPGLVVLYDLAELPATHVGQLVQRRPGQIVFAHASPWTADSPIAPDVTTLLTQALEAPWEARDAVDDRSIEAIAADILGSPTTLGPDELVADDPAGWAALVGQVWPLAPAPRARLWAGGPVPSNRFT